MAVTVTNRKVNLMGTLNVVFGDVTLKPDSEELITGLKHVMFFQAVQDTAGQVSAVFNSNNGTKNSKNGSMWVAGGKALIGAGSLPSSARFMAIGV